MECIFGDDAPSSYTPNMFQEYMDMGKGVIKALELQIDSNFGLTCLTHPVPRDHNVGCSHAATQSSQATTKQCLFQGHSYPNNQ